MAHKTGERLYKYQLLKQLGEGYFGEVWLAKDDALDATTALKILSKNYLCGDECLLEAQIGNKLHHKNLMNIQSADVIEYGSPPRPLVLMSMPYFEKGSVIGQLNSRDFLPTNLALKCMIDILRGLEYLHGCGYFHCDIKPNNILIGPGGEYVLSDYGISRYSPSHTAVTLEQRYCLHTAPETLKDNLYDMRSDIYQVGLTAFRLFNGIASVQEVFPRNHDESYHLILSGKIVDKLKYKEFVPKKIQRIIAKAIKADPNKRFQTAVEMRRAFEKVSLGGYCTSDINERVIFISDNKEYRYEIISISKEGLDFVAYKKNLDSGRETKVSKFCIKNSKEGSCLKQIQKMTDELT